jgi:hypothetical protein
VKFTKQTSEIDEIRLDLIEDYLRGVGMLLICTACGKRHTFAVRQTTCPERLWIYCPAFGLCYMAGPFDEEVAP